MSAGDAPEPLPDFAPGLERAFASEPAEGAIPVVAIAGELPRDLRGTYYLNGPARFRAGSVAYRNWLDGDGMVLAVRFDGGEVSAQQRFVQTRKLAEERSAGRAIYRTFGTRFEGDRLVHGVTVASPVNLSAYPYAGTLLAFGEQGQPWELDPQTLATRGPATFGGAVTAVTPFSGHPKVDPHTGELVTFGVSFAPRDPTLLLFRFGADGKLALRARVPLPFPASIHDFAISQRFAVFHVAPYLLTLDALRQGATVLEALAWQPELGTRLLVLSRETGELVAEVAAGHRYCLHLLNAWDAGSQVTVDLLELDRPIYQDYDGLPALFVDSCSGRAVRYTIDLDRRRAEQRETPVLGTPDFPTCDRRRLARRCDTGWLLTLSRTGARGRKFFDRMLQVDWAAGHVVGSWEAPRDLLLAGEPAFAAHAGAEAGGTLIAPLWDSVTGSSRLALFDPDDLAAGPHAVVELAHRAALGFHSTWHGGNAALRTVP